MEKSRESYLAQLAIAVVASIMLVGSFKINQSLDDFMLYAPGVSLIFIPAGVKLLCILVGGFPAALGVYIGSVYLSTLMWTQVPSIGNLFLALIAVSSYALAVYLVKRQFKVIENLSNLTYWHVIVLSASASVINGFGLNLAYWSQGVTKAEEVLVKSSAMAFGDFLGCFVVVMVFNGCARALGRRRG